MEKKYRFNGDESQILRFIPDDAFVGVNQIAEVLKEKNICSVKTASNYILRMIKENKVKVFEIKKKKGNIYRMVKKKK